MEKLRLPATEIVKRLDISRSSTQTIRSERFVQERNRQKKSLSSFTLPSHLSLRQIRRDGNSVAHLGCVQYQNARKGLGIVPIFSLVFVPHWNTYETCMDAMHSRYLSFN